MHVVSSDEEEMTDAPDGTMERIRGVLLVVYDVFCAIREESGRRVAIDGAAPHPPEARSTLESVSESLERLLAGPAAFAAHHLDAVIVGTHVLLADPAGPFGSASASPRSAALSLLEVQLRMALGQCETLVGTLE